jgi:anti-sigma factor (TIGR02949 family)
MSRPKKECKGLLPHITNVIDGDAGKAACQRVKRHLVGCEKCRMHVDAEDRVINLFKRWRDESMPDGVKIRLRERLSAEMAGGKPRGAARSPRRRGR